MRLVDFCINDTPPRLGVVVGQSVLEVGEPTPAGSLSAWLATGDFTRFDTLRTLIPASESDLPAGGEVQINGRAWRVFALNSVRLCPPVNHPVSLRDFYAFEQHVRTANENRGRDVPPEWYEIPVFYFSNPRALYGNGDVIPYPRDSKELDYELEVAAVIGKQGRDIAPENAEAHILGYMIYNDWSARDLQRVEMRVGLGPSKGKDFAQSFGPFLVTPEDLQDRHAGRPGVYDLTMTVRVNGVEQGRGNWRDIHYSFGELIAHASRNATLYPGDIIGSGTVGTGCLLETTRAQGPYLRVGDVVELEIERLGILKNTIGAP